MSAHFFTFRGEKVQEQYEVSGLNNSIAPVGEGVVSSALVFGLKNPKGLTILLWLFMAICFLYKASTALAAWHHSPKQCAKPNNLTTHAWDILGVKKIREAVRHVQKKTYLTLTQERFRKAGSSTYVSSIFGRSMIDTAEPENMQAILSTNFQDWSIGSSRKQTWAPLMGRGIFTTDGEAWKAARTRLRPTSTFDAGSDFAILERHVQTLLEICRIGSRNTVDLSSLSSRYTLDTATELFFGKACGSLQNALVAANKAAEKKCSSFEKDSSSLFADAFNRSQRTMADMLVLGKLSAILLARRIRQQFRDDCSTIHAFVDERVRETTQKLADSVEREKHVGGGRKHVFLERLLQDGVDPEAARFDLISLVFAGRDTTASLLSNIWFTLARRPDVYSRLRTEIIDVLDASTQDNPGSIVPTNANLRDMKYLHACINESLRLHPPVPINSRAAVRDTILPRGGGPDGTEPVFVSKGTRVGYNVYAMHRRKDLWGDDADEYRPDRWLEGGRCDWRTDWKFMPFSGGPRVCLGQHLALAQARYVICRLVQHFTEISAECADSAAGDTTGITGVGAAQALSSDECAEELLDGTQRPDSSSSPVDDGSERQMPSGPCVPWKWREELTLTLSSADGAWVRVVE